MNERIKELNLQAMSIVMNGNDPDGDIEQMYIPSEFTKKFAELILEEVMQELFINGHEDAFDFLNKHFGVEE